MFTDSGYRQALEIYATSIDYDPKAEISILFFKKVQNKIHYAIHGQTAAEVIYTRADAEKDFMGLTTFVGNQPTLKEAVIAKNYLSEKELRAMGQLVSGYLDFAERQAEREQVMTMRDWAEHLDRILTMSGEQLLQGNGNISHKQALIFCGLWDIKEGKIRKSGQGEMDFCRHAEEKSCWRMRNSGSGSGSSRGSAWKRGLGENDRQCLESSTMLWYY